MKVAVFSESSADEAAIRILLEGLLGRATQVIPISLRTRGWPSVVQLLPGVLQHLHYRTDAEALVIVVDADDSPVHQPEHDEPGKQNTDCRLCRIRQTIATTRLTLMPNRASLKTVVGVAVPAIEAWYCCNIDPQVSEMAWMRGQQSQKLPYTRQGLKQVVYKTERPSLQQETDHAIAAAQRLVADLPLLEQQFPNGFGSLSRDVRGW